MLSRWLRLWFGFRDPVDRGTYARHGVGLTALKYSLDALLIGRFAGKFWTPLDYLNPLLSVRLQLLRAAPQWLPPALVAIALPFLWIGVSMSMRRAVDAGRSPWLALLFFLPGVNLFLMLGLCLPASASGRPEPAPVVAARAESASRFRSAMLGVAASFGITVLSVAVGIYLRRRYSTGLFLGVPFTIGYISAYIYNYRTDPPAGQSLLLALGSVTLAAGAMVLFALEGAVCVAMALPIAWVIAWPGAVLGRAMARRAVYATTGALALVGPLLVGVEPRATPPTHEVVTVVEIAAPPERVWPHVVAFPDLPPPSERLFRAALLRLHDRQLRRADHRVAGQSPPRVRRHGPGPADGRADAVSRRAAAAPRRLLPRRARRVPPDRAARRENAARGPRRLRRRHVSPGVLDDRRPGHRERDSCPGPASYSGAVRAGTAPSGAA